MLWLPVLGRIPGIPEPKPVVRFGYLVAQAVVPAFLSFIYIFSRRPLYPEFARSHAAVGLRPLNDQQIAGFVSKLTMLFVLLIVGAVVLARAPRSEEDFGADDLVWADVERQFERVDRQGLRDSGPSKRRRAGPPTAWHPEVASASPTSPSRVGPTRQRSTTPTARTRPARGRSVSPALWRWVPDRVGARRWAVHSMGR